MHMLSTLSLLGASENASQAGGRRRADDIYRTASKSSAAAVSSTRPLGGRDGPGCRDSACLSSSRSARPQAAASPTSVATMVNACVQSPTEPGVTMACSSLLGGVCRAEYGEVASVTCEGPQFFLGFNCEFVQLGESPGGRHGYSVGVALRRGWWQLRRPFMAQRPCPRHASALPRPADPVRGRGGPERRRRPQLGRIGKPSLVRAGSVPQRSTTGMGGHHRSCTVWRNRRSLALQLRHLGLCEWAIRIVVPKVVEHRGVRSRVAGQAPSTVDVAAPARAVSLPSVLAAWLPGVTQQARLSRRLPGWQPSGFGGVVAVDHWAIRRAARRPGGSWRRPSRGRPRPGWPPTAHRR
jgi:hypothetical protein